MNKIITKTYTQFNEEENFLSETLFHNANGYIGVRGSLEEGVKNGVDTMRGTYIKIKNEYLMEEVQKLRR